MKLLEISPAKLNLCLEVLRKRPDGYHDIRSLMIQVDLCDEVQVEIDEDGEGIRCECDHPDVPAGEANLAHKAARVFLIDSGIRAGVNIRIKKRIPLGGGLAGGSGNAAATLRALNKLTARHYSREQLMELGLRVGSDVPFLLQSSPAWVEGRGERLKPASVPENLQYLIINPGYEVSTAWAYGNLALTAREFEPSISYFVIEGIKMFNHLEITVFKRYPLLREIKESVMASGARAALMSGSGPTVFGVFDEIEAVREASEKLGEKHNFNVRTAKLIVDSRCEA